MHNTNSYLILSLIFSPKITKRQEEDEEDEEDGDDFWDTCFPSSSKVNLENGDSVTMSEVQIGDRVQTGIYTLLDFRGRGDCRRGGGL